MFHNSQKITSSILKLSVYLSPFIFPLYLIRFPVAGIPFNIMEVCVYGLLILFLVERVQTGAGFEWKKGSGYYLFAGLVLAGATLGLLTAPHFIPLPGGELLDAWRKAMGVWNGWLLAPLLYFFILTQSLESGREVKILLRNYVYSGMAVCLVAFVVVFSGNGLSGDHRLIGFYESANYLSLYIVPPILLGLYFCLTEKRSEYSARFLNWAALAVMISALFFTQSYAAVLGVFGACFLWGIQSFSVTGKSTAILFKTTGILLLIFLSMVLVFSGTEKFRQFLEFRERSSTSVRLEIYEVALGLIGSHPFTGVGPGLFQDFYQTEAPGILGHAPMEWNMPHPHNLFLAFWLNAGFMGAMALVLMLFLVHRLFAYPLIALWGLLIHGLFDTPFWKNDLAMSFWLIIASILILQFYGTHSDSKLARPIRRRLDPVASKSAPAKRLPTPKK